MALSANAAAAAQRAAAVSLRQQQQKQLQQQQQQQQRAIPPAVVAAMRQPSNQVLYWCRWASYDTEFIFGCSVVFRPFQELLFYQRRLLLRRFSSSNSSWRTARRCLTRWALPVLI